MSTSVTDSLRPARSSATGPITRGLRLLSVLAALAITARTAQAVYREGERMMVAVLVGVQLIYLDITLSILGGPGGGVLIWIGMAVLLGSVVIGIIRLVRAGR